MKQTVMLIKHDGLFHRSFRQLEEVFYRKLRMERVGFFLVMDAHYEVCIHRKKRVPDPAASRARMFRSITLRRPACLCDNPRFSGRFKNVLAALGDAIGVFELATVFHAIGAHRQIPRLLA